MLKEVRLLVLLFPIGWNSITLTQLDCTMKNTPYGHAKGCSRDWYLDDGTIIGDTLVVLKALELIMEYEPNGPTSLDAALLSALERIVTASRPGFVDWQWRLSILPFAFWGLGVYSATSGNTFDDALCIPLLSVSKPFSACSKVFMGDIYGDHAVSDVSIIGIKHRHNVVCDTLVDICFWSGILVGKEVDIGLGGGCDKPLRPANMLLYSCDEGLYVCVDLTGSSPLTQSRMVDFVPGRAVIDATHPKRVKYKAKCANIRYGFLPFSFSLLGELEKDAVTLLKQI
ncbi:hypothetical protein Tco_0455694 [Tanacetum coccineum]